MFLKGIIVVVVHAILFDISIYTLTKAKKRGAIRGDADDVILVSAFFPIFAIGYGIAKILAEAPPRISQKKPLRKKRL